MRRWLVASLLALCAVALNAQGLETTTVANLPDCVDGSPWIILVVDGASSTDCSTGSSSTEVVCTCKDGTIAGLSTSGGSSNSFETQNVDNGTDPVADSSTDTLNWVSGTGITITGDSSTDTITIASTIPDLILDLGDDGGNDSTAIAELATIYDRFGVVTEPSADKALFDFAALIDGFLAGPPASPGTPDCEFDSSICSYTAVTGSSATIDPYATGTVASYSTALRSGFVAMQAGQASGTVVELRYDYTLADGEAVYAALYPGLHMNGVNNTSQCLLGLNSTDTGHDDGTFFRVQIDKQVTDNYRFLSYDGADIGSWEVGGAPAVWFAIARRTLTYYAWASINGGVNWIYLGGDTVGSAHTNVWLACFAGGAITASHAIPVSLWDWIRTGDDDPYAPGW